MGGLGGAELRAPVAPVGVARVRGPVGAVAARLSAARGVAVPPARAHEWLALTPRDRMPAPPHVAFPKPPKAPGTYPLSYLITPFSLSNERMNDVICHLLHHNVYNECKYLPLKTIKLLYYKTVDY